MINKKKSIKKNFFETFATKVTEVTGSTKGFIAALTLVIVWALTGPIFHYSENWQLVINTGTTIITFLMVFLIQKTQNKDSLAIQLKLNELVAAHKFASNRMVNVEDLTEDELKTIQKYYSKLSEFTKKEESLQESHSIDEAKGVHTMKQEFKKSIKTPSNKKPKIDDDE
jgi:low affinity Fe/Cu permease